MLKIKTLKRSLGVALVMGAILLMAAEYRPVSAGCDCNSSCKAVSNKLCAICFPNGDTCKE